MNLAKKKPAWKIAFWIKQFFKFFICTQLCKFISMGSLSSSANVPNNAFYKFTEISRRINNQQKTSLFTPKNFQKRWKRKKKSSKCLPRNALFLCRRRWRRREVQVSSPHSPLFLQLQKSTRVKCQNSPVTQLFSESDYHLIGMINEFEVYVAHVWQLSSHQTSL